MSHDFEALRGEFPGLAGRAYFVAHSFGPCPAEAFDDVEAYARTLRDRPTRFGEWIERLEEIYGLFEQLLGASPGSVALRDSATAGQAAVLAAIEPRVDRNRIVISGMHFPSIRYLVQAQTRRGFEVDVVESPDGIHLRAEDIIARIDARTAAVCVPSVASFNGALLDVSRVVETASRAGAIPLVDAYASVGIVPLDVSNLAPCVVVGGTVKWLGGGGTGLAFLHVHPALSDRLVPAYPGWMADARFMDFHPEHRPATGARRFQQGTPAIEPVYTARAGLRFVLRHGIERLRERNVAQLQRIEDRARARCIPVRSPGSADRGGAIALQVPDAAAAVEALARRDFLIDTRMPGAVRLGPHVCVSLQECERAVDELAAIVEATTTSEA